MRTQLTTILTAAFMCIAITVHAQLESYSFDYIYQMEAKNPNGKSTIIDYYLPSNGDSHYFAAVTSEGIINVFDNDENRMYTFMEGKDGDNTYMSIKMDLAEIIESVETTENMYTYESAGYGNLLGYECELFRMTSENMTSEVWVADIRDGTFASNAGARLSTYLMAKAERKGDDSAIGALSGLPLKIVTKKKRGQREKIATMTCLKFEPATLTINTSEYRRLF